MLGERIVALFPPIERLVAEEASNVVGVGLDRVIEESCSRKLQEVVSRMTINRQ